MLLYSLLYLTGYSDMPIEELKRFRQLGSKTPGHPEYRHAEGIELTTGPLGEGIAESVGMALGERVMNARFGDELGYLPYSRRACDCSHGRQACSMRNLPRSRGSGK